MNLERRKIFDISPEVSSRTAVFPGDTPFQQDFLLKISSGSNLDLSTIKTTVHIGAHTDAPCHYHVEGVSIEKRDLNYYLGAAQVIEVKIPRGHRILPKDILCEIEAPRVLFKTRSYPDPIPSAQTPPARDTAPVRGATIRPPDAWL